MTDYKQLCAELVDAIDSGIPTDRMHSSPLMLRARDALGLSQKPEIYYEFSVLNDEYCTEAGGTAPTLQQAVDEGRRYFAEYSQDGNYTLEVRRVEVIPVPS